MSINSKEQAVPLRSHRKAADPPLNDKDIPGTSLIGHESSELHLVYRTQALTQMQRRLTLLEKRELVKW